MSERFTWNYDASRKACTISDNGQVIEVVSFMAVPRRLAELRGLDVVATQTTETDAQRRRRERREVTGK